MKYMILIITALFSVKPAFAHVVEVNKEQKIVYYTPTPQLEVTLTDLERDGGIFSVSLNYDPEKAQIEKAALQTQYADYSLQVLMAQHSSESLIVSIPEAGLHQETIVKQGQMGPYLNLQLMINKSQTQQLKLLAKTSANIVKISIPVVSSFRAKRILETYSSETVCQELEGRDFGAMVLQLLRMRKPEGIRYEETFAAYKQSAFENCFEMASAKINSFKELLSKGLVRKSMTTSIVGLHQDLQSRDVNYALIPEVVLNIQ